MTNIDTMKLALDALETLDCGDSYKTHNAATALRQAISEAEQAEGKCNPHPDAPHGFDRNASHNMGRYVCDCEGWSPDDMAYQPGGLSMDQEPAAWVGEFAEPKENLPEGTPLYTAPPKAENGCVYCNHPLYAGIKCNNCGKAGQEPWDTSDMAHRAGGLSMEQEPVTNTQLMEGYRIGLAEMREKCAKVCETDELCCKCGDECAVAIRAIKFEGDTGFRPVSEMIGEQAEQEHDGHWSDCSVHNEPAYPNGECDCGGYPPKAEQEPVAWHEPGSFGNVTTYQKWAIEHGWQPLYTAPHPVKEVELTDDEVWKIYGITGLGNGMALRFARAVIAAHKEKNK